MGYSMGQVVKSFTNDLRMNDEIVKESQGFWQLLLDESSSIKCTFNTPFGRYMFLRLPFGVCSAPEVYHKTIHEVFENILNVDKSMDDIIVWGQNKEEHDRSLQQVLQAAQEVNLKLNRDKCKFGVTQLTFLGDLLIKPDPTKVSAINNMRKPECKQDVQRFLGMVTYLAKWIPELSDKSAPLRQLLDEKIMWQWSHEQEQSFQILKQVITSHPVLQYYDPKKGIKISSDASQDGLGAVILQQHDGKLLPVAFASRAMTDAEIRYAQIEKELLGITFACERLHQLIFGATFDAETDHKPLVNLMKKPLNDCPLRIQRLMLRLQKYDFRLSYTPGKYLITADALSRATDTTAVNTSDMPQHVDVHVDMVIQSMPISDQRLDQVRTETRKDSVMSSLINIILTGWPNNKYECPPDLASYWNVREELSVSDNVVLRGSKIVMPQSLRLQKLNKIHEGHLGVEKCRRSRAREVMYWSGMNADIMQLVESCMSCLKFKPQQISEPLMPNDVPVRPWQKVGTDLFYHNRNTYLLVVDYYSIYPEVITLTTTTSQSVIRAMKCVFARHGIPDVVISDNGPQYASQEFRMFAREWNFVHDTSSPHFPQSNGQSENAVKVVKNLLKK